MTDADGLPGTPRRDPGRPAASRIGDHDGGVSRRLLIRCRAGAVVLGTVGVVFLVFAAVRSWGMVSAGAALLATGLLTGGALLAWRARIWSAVTATTLPAEGEPDAIIGPPRALSPGVPSAPVKRKLGPSVVPIRRFDDPQPGGGALIVHARADAATLAADNEVEIWQIGPGAVVGPAAPYATEPEKKGATGGRFVIRRSQDGMIFLATSRLTDTW
jgi:hypothetical protein